MDGTGADGLNRAQRTAVTTLSGPLLVLAGAGTGKTRVITVRIVELIKSGIHPDRILAVTFTNKAAKEMRERALGLLGRRKKNAKLPEICTFHSLCVRILRRHAKKLGYPDQFSIYDRGDQESLARSALRDIRVGSQSLRPGDLLSQVSAWKGQGITPEEAARGAKKDAEVLAAAAYARYQVQLRASGAMDFDDLLLQTERLFTEHPEARFAEATRFDHLLIDEYQDTNGLQYRIVRALADRHRNLCVVGDDDQSIYGWRGAEVEHILNFRDHWPEAKVVRLEENYRCTEWVIHLANTLIAHNKARHDKVLRAARGRGSAPRFLKFDEEDAEAEMIVSEIHGKITREGPERVVASDIAILFRTNEQPRAFETQLRRFGVPYVLVGGQSFFDRKEIKDLLCYLRVIANPLDEVSLLRIINVPARGIGPSTIQKLLDEAVAAGDPLWKLLPAATAHPDVPDSAGKAIDRFVRLVDEFRSRMGHESVSQLLTELIARIDYKAEIARVYKDPSEHETRWNGVEQLLNAVVTYESRDESPSLLGFLEESSLSSRDDEKDDDKRREHSVTLMTLHSAKGLEFPHVYLVGLEEGLLPHKRSVLERTVDEERRLAYVGVTRAKDELSLSYCRQRLKWGKLRPQLPSRFLLEMRGETAKAEEIALASFEKLREEREKLDELNADDGSKKKGKTKAKPRAAAVERKGPRAAAEEQRSALEAARASGLSLPEFETERDRAGTERPRSRRKEPIAFAETTDSVEEPTKAPRTAPDGERKKPSEVRLTAEAPAAPPARTLPLGRLPPRPLPSSPSASSTPRPDVAPKGTPTPALEKAVAQTAEAVRPDDPAKAEPAPRQSHLFEQVRLFE